MRILSGRLSARRDAACSIFQNDQNFSRGERIVKRPYEETRSRNGARESWYKKINDKWGKFKEPLKDFPLHRKPQRDVALIRCDSKQHLENEVMRRMLRQIFQYTS